MTRGAHKTNSGLCVLLVLCILGNNRVIAAPYPNPPGLGYREEFHLDPNRNLLDQMAKDISMKTVRIANEVVELEEEKLQLAMLKEANKVPPQQENSEEYPENLPPPAPLIHAGPSGKRTSYMALCHFKICNMGRKRQM